MLLHAVIVTTAAISLSAGQAWAQSGNVTSFHGRSPTADEIYRGLVPDGTPEGLVPPSGEAAGPVGERGISVVTPTGAPTGTPTGSAGSQRPSGRPSGAARPAPVAAGPCPTTGNAVALEINFARGSAEFDARARQTLDEVAQVMSMPQLAGCSFMVEGHTDATGTWQGNQLLSERRAQAVRSYLASRHIDRRRLHAVGKGQAEPLNAADPNAAENRRVQFRLVGG